MTHSSETATPVQCSRFGSNTSSGSRLLIFTFDFASARVVGERDPEGAAFAGVEGMHVTGHAVRHFPLRDGARIEEGSINARAGGVNVAADTGRVHAGPGTQAKPAVRAASRVQPVSFCLPPQRQQCIRPFPWLESSRNTRCSHRRSTSVQVSNCPCRRRERRSEFPALIRPIV